MTQIWYLRMKQGATGENFAKELWEKGRAGILWGPWRTKDVLDGQVITERAIRRYFGKPHMREYSKSGLDCAIRFCLKTEKGQHIVVAFDEALHVGTIASDDIYDDETPRATPDDPSVVEHVKYVRVTDRKSFRLAKLPSSFWLIPQTGRGTFQGIGRARPLAELLVQARTEADVSERIRSLGPERFLETVSPQGWESLCVEYLRSSMGFRSLLLSAGRTLAGIDVVGIDANGRRIVAQCKNDPTPIPGEIVGSWAREYGSRGDRAIYFARGGITGTSARLGCDVVDGAHIAKWLQGDEDYFKALKRL